MFRNISNSPYGLKDRWKTYRTARDSKELVQRLKLLKELDFHNGCVNTICWNETGDYILSGSDDIHLCISDANTFKKKVLIRSAHRNNIFSAKFLPCSNDRKIISCSGDGIIAYTNLDTPFPTDTNTFNCHLGTTYELSIVLNDPFSFLSCGEDKTVRLFDLRTKTNCTRHDCNEDILINCHKAVTAMSVNPALPYQLAIGCSDSTIRIYDRRMIGTPAAGYSNSDYTKGLLTCSLVSFSENRKHRITSLCYSNDGDELLVSYSTENIYLFKLKDDRFVTYSTVKQETSPVEQSQPGSISAPPPIKKLRVRGDWSDTGPNARPDSEISDTSGGVQESSRPFQSAVMDRMSDVLNRMLNEPVRSLNQGSSQTDSPDVSATEEGATSNSTDTESQSTVSCQPSTSKNLPVNDPKPSSSSSKNTKTNSMSEIQSKECPEEPRQLDSPQSCGAEKVSNVVPDIEVQSNSQTDQSEACKTRSNVKDLSPKEGLQSIESNLKSMRQSFIDKNKMDPVVNLHYSAKSVSSGIISMDVANTLERKKVESSNEADVSGASDELLQATLRSSASETPKSKSSKTVDCVSSVCDISKPSTSKVTDQSVGPTLPKDVDVGEENSLVVENDLPTSSRNRPSDSADPVESSAPMDTDSENNDLTLSDESDDEVEQLSEAVLTAVHTRIINYTRETPEPEKPATDIEQDMNVKLKTLPQYAPYKCYEGHRNARTMIKEANFWGDKYVISGSDCGHVFFWDKESAEVVMTLEADKHVVNCVQPHPFDPVLATSGIDYDVKLWAPIGPQTHFDSEKAAEIMRRNKVMLDECQDTITVPASLMIRMLASLNHLRSASRTILGWRDRLRSRRNQRQHEESDE